MTERVLITGITGFVGSHLADYLRTKNLEIYGTRRWRSKMDNVEHIRDKIKFITADMRDGHSLQNVINEAEPDYVFHLAAQSFVPMSWRAPSDTMHTNIIGTVNLFEAIRNSKCDPKIHIAGSSEEYGMVYPDEVPIKETNPLRPLSPYGVSKVAQDKLAYQYHNSYGLKTVVTRAFNHTGPRRGDVFATSNFAKQSVEIEKGLREPIMYVGNLEAKRDFTDVRDIVRAYWLALQKCDFGEVYNVCSGETIPIQDVFNAVVAMSTRFLGKAKMWTVEQVPDRMRPSDVEILHGDFTKFRNKTGWVPEIPFEKTMRDLMEYWREKI
jgi:GDP-4-dehydro-6-deoxy-D-mannose reductase